MNPLFRAGTGGSPSPASCTIFFLLSPDSRPLLCFFRYHVNHAVWLPVLIERECFGLVQNKKNCVVNRTTPHSPVWSLKRHSFDTSLHHAVKSSVFCKLQSYRSEPPGRSSMDGCFPTTPKNTETDQNGLWRHLTRIALSFLRRISTASETDETLTDWHSQHTCTCEMSSHSCPVM